MSGPANETPNPAPPGKPAPQGQPTQPAPSSGGGSASQATAAVTNAVSSVRERLVAGEQMVLAASAIIVVVYLLFQFLLDYLIVGDFTVVLAILTMLAIWVHRWGHYDFGKGYRVLIGALGLSLALFAIINFLGWVRVGGDSAGFMHLIGRIIYWISGIAAGYGAWLVFRIRED
jgi:hypothetical protein